MAPLAPCAHDFPSTQLRVAKPERERERRQPRRYERPRSLLVQLAYHRVVMDEVQLVGNSMAAETVSMIERTSSIAVSGTPVTRLDDLRSLFRFLRVLGPYDTAAAFKRLLTPELAPTLERVLGMLATRNTKAQVRSETTLPQQTRYLLPVELGPVQRTFYEELWTTALSDLQISGHGNSVGLVYDAKGTMAQNSDGSLRHAQPDVSRTECELDLLADPPRADQQATCASLAAAPGMHASAGHGPLGGCASWTRHRHQHDPVDAGRAGPHARGCGGCARLALPQSQDEGG